MKRQSKSSKVALGLGAVLGLGLLAGTVTPASAAPYRRHVPQVRRSAPYFNHGWNNPGRFGYGVSRLPVQDDIDRDGIRDRNDRDRDGDGIRNRYDRDKDGDGVRNGHDDSPKNPFRR